MKKEIHFPTILGLLFLLATIAAGVYLSGQTQIFGSKASSTCHPKNLQISNLTASSFNIFYLTDSDNCLGTVNINNQSIADITSSKANVHYYLVENLKPDNFYSYHIISGGQIIESDNYVIKTASQPQSAIPSSDLAWGRVYNSANNPASGSIVFLSITGASPISARVTSDGKWNIPLATSLNSELNDWFSPPQNSSQDIIVFAPDGSITQVTGNTAHNNPVADIILGQNSFTEPKDTLQTGQLPESGSNHAVKKLVITNPSVDESISTSRPDFFGSAPIGSELIIKVESPITINGSTVAGNDGSWNWSPSQDLSPGEHTITVTTTNPSSGLIETVSRKFVVLAAENNYLAFTASGSATPIPPTSTPILPTPTLLPPSPTTYVRPATPSTSTPVPITGNSHPLMILLFSATTFISLSLIIIKRSDNLN